MAYSNFTEERVLSKFGITKKSTDLFPIIQEMEASEYLKRVLDSFSSQMLVSEKARSELIISPVLLDLYLQNDKKIGFYSGANLDADFQNELNGECDFILSTSTTNLKKDSPIFGLVEAKKNDIDLGIGQCIAQMYGAKIMNERAETGISTIFGAVTTGEIWQFMKLEDQTIWLDEKRYYIDRVERILGILQNIVDKYKLVD